MSNNILSISTISLSVASVFFGTANLISYICLIGVPNLLRYLISSDIHTLIQQYYSSIFTIWLLVLPLRWWLQQHRQQITDFVTYRMENSTTLLAGYSSVNAVYLALNIYFVATYVMSTEIVLTTLFSAVARYHIHFFNTELNSLLWNINQPLLCVTSIFVCLHAVSFIFSKKAYVPVQKN